MNFTNGKVKFAIIGSGAIAEEGYLPAAEMVPEVLFTHLVDLDIERARDVAERFRIPKYVSNYRELFGEVDAVIVATPPDSHANISIDCMNHGLHVLCEKPLTISAEEAKKMAATSKVTDTHLAVGMVRRLSWSAKVLEKLVQQGFLGRLSHFNVEEGWEFNWPLRTAHMFEADSSGGVVLDAGPHLFDLLLWILRSDRERVLSYKDDNWGGVGMNAEVKLEIERNSQRITGNIEISYTRKLRNTMKIYGENGCFEAETVGANKIFFFPQGENKNPIILSPKNAKTKKKNEDFVPQLKNFVYSIINNKKYYVMPEDAIKTMTLIDECYRLRKTINPPWNIKHLESFFGVETNGWQ